MIPLLPVSSAPHAPSSPTQSTGCAELVLLQSKNTGLLGTQSFASCITYTDVNLSNAHIGSSHCSSPTYVLQVI